MPPEYVLSLVRVLIDDHLAGCPNMTATQLYGCADPKTRCAACIAHELETLLSDPHVETKLVVRYGATVK